MNECGNAKAQARRAERANKRMMNRAMENMPMADVGPRSKVIAKGPRGNIMTKGIDK